ncbi:NAD-dependent epimerase/dehydratase family protein [Evansella sp. AB-rgal1]|uniref:NAD-dependent epimerase/dehydratase family protein n=1 Tax=Evansella sp. AB-rgal1 TaxID=3242696 RepID=UPI00359DF007
MRILITGAGGFTGHHACEYFEEAGYEVIAVKRNKLSVNDNIVTEYCDLTDQFEVEKLINKTKPRYVLHLAGQNHVADSWEKPIESIQANMLTTSYLIEAMRKERITSKIIVVGSALQFDLDDVTTLTHPYSLSKSLQVLVAKSWNKLYGVDVVIAKPSNIIGPGPSNGVCSIIARQIVRMEHNEEISREIAINNPYIQRDFIDVRDVIKGYNTLFQKGVSGETYEIASGQSYLLMDVIETMKSISKVQFKVKSHQKVKEKPVQINPRKLRDLGWTTTIPFSTSIDDVFQYFRKEHSNNKK